MVDVSKLSIGLMLMVSLSATVKAQQGVIALSGEIIVSSCTVQVKEASGTDGVYVVDMGQVSKFALGAQDQASGGRFPQTPKDVSMTIRCDEVDRNIDVDIEAVNGTAGKGLAVVGGAENVQLMLKADQDLIDFSDGPVVSLARNVPTDKGAVHFPLKAFYALAPGRALESVQAGRAHTAVSIKINYP